VQNPRAVGGDDERADERVATAEAPDEAGVVARDDEREPGEDGVDDGEAARRKAA
jgi:hypothetical protein